MRKMSLEDVKDNVELYLEEKDVKRDIREIYDYLLRKELIGGHIHMSTQRLAALMSKDKQRRFRNTGKRGFKGKWVLNHET